jgi:hypothetical protein
VLETNELPIFAHRKRGTGIFFKEKKAPAAQPRALPHREESAGHTVCSFAAARFADSSSRFFVGLFCFSHHFLSKFPDVPHF